MGDLDIVLVKKSRASDTPISCVDALCPKLHCVCLGLLIARASGTLADCTIAVNEQDRYAALLYHSNAPEEINSQQPRA